LEKHVILLILRVLVLITLSIL